MTVMYLARCNDCATDGTVHSFGCEASRYEWLSAHVRNHPELDCHLEVWESEEDVCVPGYPVAFSLN